MWRVIVMGALLVCACESAPTSLDANPPLDVGPIDAPDAPGPVDAHRLRVPRDAYGDAYRVPDASRHRCATSEACDDGVACNGREICGFDEAEDRYDCFPGAPCAACNTAGTLCCLDYDADGVPAEGCTDVFDCDDWNSTVYPGNAESCDRRDQDCDGAIDEGITGTTYHPDCDCDGAAGAGYMETSPCDLRPHSPRTCAGGCWSARVEDCDDTVRDVSPFFEERRCDGRDDDCDGVVDESVGDVDGDGFFGFACGAPVDCDDRFDWVHPGAAEACDRVDSDCDGIAEDRDADGHAALDAACVGGPLARDDCDDDDRRLRPGARETCDGVDEDCDGIVDGLTAYCGDRHATRTECVDARCFDLACSGGWAACDEPLACTNELSSDERHCGACDVPCGSGACESGCTPFAALSLARSGTEGLVAQSPHRLTPRGAEGSRGVRAFAIGGGARLCHAWVWGAVDCEDGSSGGWVDGAVEVGSGADFACVRTARSEVWCWGRGRLGDGIVSAEARPAVRVSRLVFANALSVGRFFACAIDTDSAFCWGSGTDGTLGNGASIDASAPVPVSLARSTIGVAAGDLHACALARDQTVWCWGRNDRGQLGVPAVVGSTNTPREVVGLPSVTALVAGGAGTCALTTTGERWCWGANEAGQLGDGTRTDRTTPTRMEADVRRVWLGTTHGCSETNDRTLRCWGENDDGRLGDGTTTDSLVPVVVDYQP